MDSVLEEMIGNENIKNTNEKREKIESELSSILPE